MIEYIVYNLFFMIVLLLIVLIYVKYIAEQALDQLSMGLKSEVDEYVKNLKSFNSEKIEALHQNSEIIISLNKHLKDFNSELSKIENKVRDINDICENRDILEKEIVKFKNIINRMEKRNKRVED